MLDVHPPHTPTHSWKDFLIHIATIVIGLLIAIGLEQSVEYLHHREQFHTLESDLQNDSALNAGWCKEDMTSAESISQWAIEQANAVEAAGDTGPLTLRPIRRFSLAVPNTGVWLAAQSSGEITLLPRDEQNWLTDMQREETQTFVSDASGYGHLLQSFGDLDKALLGHAVLNGSADLDLSKLNPAQRSTVADRLTGIAEAARKFEQGVLIYMSYNEFIFTSPHGKLGDKAIAAQFARIIQRNSATYPGLRNLFIAP